MFLPADCMTQLENSGVVGRFGKAIRVCSRGPAKIAATERKCLLCTGNGPAQAGPGKPKPGKQWKRAARFGMAVYPPPKASQRGERSRAGTGRLSVLPALVARLSLTAIVFSKLRNAVSTTGEAGFFSNQPLFSTIEFVRNFNLFLIVL